MSHYIQDNQAVVFTADKKFLLFTKGGDNNVFSFDNKRCTSWSFHATFDNEEEYNKYITDLMMSDVAGGSWQFASLKNKSFHGYTEYEKTVYKRFEKALKYPLISQWKLSDVSTENIYEFENSLKSLFREKKISLNDESGVETNLGIIWSYKDGVSKEEAGVKRLNSRRKHTKHDGEEEYRDFCFKYSDKPLSEVINDVIFCSSMVKFKKNWSNSISLLEIYRSPMETKDFSFANFNILVNSNENTIVDLLSSYHIDRLLKRYPIQFETLMCLSTFNDRVEKVIAKEKEKESDYNLKRWQENLEEIQNANYKVLKEKQELEIEEELGKAKDNFIEAWNDLVRRCYFKNTNEQLPRFMTILKESMSTDAFTLQDVKDECNNNFLGVISNYENQYKKNQSAIKKAFKELINEYTLLFNQESIDALCDYFGFEKPNKAIKAIERPKVNTQLTLLDFAS